MLAAAIQVHARPRTTLSSARARGGPGSGAFAEVRERHAGGGLPCLRRIECAQAILDPAIGGIRRVHVHHHDGFRPPV